MNNRSTIWEEIKSADTEVKAYITIALQAFLKIKYFHEWISAHLEFSEQERRHLILDAMKEIAES